MYIGRFYPSFSFSSEENIYIPLRLSFREIFFTEERGGFLFRFLRDEIKLQTISLIPFDIPFR